MTRPGTSEDERESGKIAQRLLVPPRPRNPPADFLRVLLIRLTKLSPEGGFFVKHDEQVNQDHEDSGLDNNRCRHEEYRFADQDSQHGYVHRVANIFIETSDHQMFRRINWS